MTERKKIVGGNYSHKKLIGADLSNTDFVECDFRKSDLQAADLTGSKLYGSDLRGCEMYTADITLSCHTFRRVMFDDEQVDSMLYLLAIANINEVKRQKIVEVIGQEKYRQLQEKFQVKR